MLSWLYSKIFSEPVLPERTIPTAPAPIPPSTPPRPAKTRPGRRSRMQILRYNADQRDRGSSKPLMNGLTQPR
jgi:hypothetical protein